MRKYFIAMVWILLAQACGSDTPGRFEVSDTSDIVVKAT